MEMYQNAELDIVAFDCMDVITTSDPAAEAPNEGPILKG